MSRLPTRDLNRIKRKLGIPTSGRLPRCPAKVHKRLHAMEEAGDFSHSDWGPPNPLTGWREPIKKLDYHFPCEVCGCSRTAGDHTSHHGWGWCHFHERGRRKGIAEKFAALHLEALQQHNPFFYISEAHMKAEIIKLGKEALAQDFSLPQEIQAVRGIMQRFYTLAADYEKEVEGHEKVVAAVEALTAAIREKGTIPEQEWLEIKESIDFIRTRLTCPLTEPTQYGLMPMSDKTRLTLASNTSEKMVRSMKGLFDMMKERWITEEAFNIWCGRLASELDKEFGEARYATDKGSFRIVDHAMAAWKRVGEPRRGT